MHFQAQFSIVLRCIRSVVGWGVDAPLESANARTNSSHALWLGVALIAESAKSAPMDVSE